MGNLSEISGIAVGTNLISIYTHCIFIIDLVEIYRFLEGYLRNYYF